MRGRRVLWWQKRRRPSNGLSQKSRKRRHHLIIHRRTIATPSGGSLLCLSCAPLGRGTDSRNRGEPSPVGNRLVIDALTTRHRWSAYQRDVALPHPQPVGLQRATLPAPSDSHL